MKIYKYFFAFILLILIRTEIYSQSISSFTTANLCYGSTSNFYSTSTINGTLDSMIWIVDMGGLKDTIRARKLDTLNYTFLYPGSFNVSLRIKTSVDTAISSQNIDIQSLASIMFNINNPVQNLSNHLFTFTPNVIVNPSGTATYLWKFGDGHSLTGSSPSYVYSSAGTFNVWLVAQTTNGCVDSIDNPVFVVNDIQEVFVKNTVFHINPNTTTYVNMNFTVSDTGRLNNDGQALLTSNITDQNNGRISGNGTFELVGNPNTVISTLPGDTFNFVEVNKTAVNSRIDLVNNTNISQLVFKSDNLVYADNDTLYIVNSSDTAISGYNASRYIVGYLSRKVVPGKSYIYPFGTSTEYHNAVIDINAINSINYITGKYSSGTKYNRLLDVKNEGPYDSLHPRGTWQFWPTYDTTGTPSITYDLNLSLNMFSGLQDNGFAILKKDASDPSDLAFQTGGGVLPAKNAYGRKVSDGYAKRTSYTSFSEFGVGMSRIEIRPGIVLCLRALLEGPYSKAQGKMDTNYIFQDTLKTYHYKQPYSKLPWNYAGSESFDSNSLPSNTIIDWMLISLRSTTAASSTFDTVAVLIRNDGYIVNTKLADSLIMMKATNLDSFYIVVKHRNHLAIMTANKQGRNYGIYKYDFTTALNKAYNQGAPPMKDISGTGAGPFAMWAGNVNGDANVNASDYSQWKANNGTIKYHGSDLNLDLNVNSRDWSVWKLNNGRTTQVP